MPKEVTFKPMRDGGTTRAGQQITPQTVDITPNTAAVTDASPFWSRDEQLIAFHSNRSNIAGTTAGTLFHIYRMRPDGTGVVALTGPLASPSLRPNSSQTEPAFNATSSSVVYIDTDNAGKVDLREFNINTRVDRSLIEGQSQFRFTGLNHPEYAFAAEGSGTGVIFAGQVGQGQPFKLFTVNTSTGGVTQLTTGVSDDRNPTLSPDPNRPVVAFDSNRANAAGTAVKAVRDIWVITTNAGTPNPVQVTNFSAGGNGSDNRQPAWSRDRIQLPTQAGQVNQQLLAFASSRIDNANDGNANGINPNGTHDIYWLKVNIAQGGGGFTVTNPESTNNPAFKLNTSDPQHIYDDLRPTWPQFVNTYRIAYQSDRTFYNAASGQSGPAGQPTDIFASTILDVNAPTLVRFNEATGDIVDIQPRITTPGSTIRISVKVADFETGIRDAAGGGGVFVQIKNPNSKYQSSDNREHKVYVSDFDLLSGGNVALGVPHEYEMQRIFAGADPNDSRVNTYANPTYVASRDDFYAFSGSTRTPEAGWLPLAFASRNAETGISTYTATYRTDLFPSDYVVDVIAYDNAVNPFTSNTQDRAVNWKIYDNIWGFSTKPFTAQNNILFVSDYSAGQKFFSTRFGQASPVNVSHTFWGTESWLTDIDVALHPTSYVNGTTQGVLLDYRNALGVDSYRDSLAVDGSFVDGAVYPVTQRYDIWRILSRGPVPDNVLAQYSPRMDQQPPDTLNGETTPRTVRVAERCVVWNAPYAGNLFTGPGTITDLRTQQQITSFLQAGGRVMITGQDIVWALTLAGSSTNAFATNVLRSSYVADDAGFTFFRIPAGPFQTSIGISGAYALTMSGAVNPVSHDPWETPKYLPGTTHVYPGPPFPPGTIDYLSRDTNFYVSGNDQNNPRTLGSYGAVYPDVIQPLQGAITDITYGGGGVGGIHYADAATGQKVVFVSMGLEGLFNDWFNPPNTSNVIQFKNRISEYMHNAVCWMRTGSVSGTVLDLEGQRMPNVLVRLSRRLDPQGRPIIEYTGLTAEDGTYTINGVEPDTYEISAVRAGFQIQKRTFTTMHGGYRDVISFRMTAAEPATITGKVTRTDGTTPIAGATVVATDVNDPNNVFTAVTDANGDYSIGRVPAFTRYRLTASAPGFGESIPLQYIITDTADPTGNGLIQPATSYGPFNFKLKAEPGTLTGLVRVNNNGAPGAPIPNATVTAVSGGVTQTTTTDANGRYTFTGNIDPGTVTITAVAPGYAQNSMTVTVASNQTTTAQDLLLTAIPPGSLSGLVTQSSDNAPITGVLVQLKDPSGNVVASTTTVAPQTVNGDTFNYRFNNVPAGVTYTITANRTGYTAVPATRQAAVASGVETRDIDFSMQPLHTFPGQLTMVSAPYDYSNNPATVAELLGVSPGDPDFKFATWDAGRYVFYPTPPADRFRLGRGYFLQHRTNLALSTQGTPAPLNQPFIIDLNTGWNMIGDPFPFAIDWTRVRVDAGTGQLLTTTEAAAAGWIGSGLYSYVSGSYILSYQLQPWLGYWARAYRNVKLVINPQTDAIGRAAAVAGTSRAVLQGGDGWAINLQVRAGELSDRDNHLGVSGRATDGFDGFKAEKPPVFGDRYVYMAFDHADWGSKNGAYGVDVRAAGPGTKAWDFTVVTSEANSSAMITWPNASTIRRGTNLVLKDMVSGATVNMTTSSSYGWNTGANAAPRKFRVEAVAADASNTLRLTGVSVRQSTRGVNPPVNISYNLSIPANVEVRILGASGSVVRRLVGRATRAAGISESVWDLRNDQNTSVPAGVYTVEIRAQSGDGGSTVRQIAPVVVVR